MYFFGKKIYPKIDQGRGEIKNGVGVRSTAQYETMKETCVLQKRESQRERDGGKEDSERAH